MTTSPTAQLQEAWTALQIAQSNGAYSGKTVQFITPDGLIDGELVRAGHSSENPGHVLVLVGDIRDRSWHTIANDTTMLVMR